MLTYMFLSNIITLCNSTLQALYLFGKMATVTIILIISSRSIAAILAMLHIGTQGVLIGYITRSSVALAAAMAFMRGSN